MNRLSVHSDNRFFYMRWHIILSTKVLTTSYTNTILLFQVGDVLRNSYIILTPWCRVLFEKLTGLQLVKKFPAFHGTRRFITAPTSVRHLSLSWASPIQSIYPYPISWRSILILSTHLRLGLPSGLFTFRFPHQVSIHSLSSPIRATCPAHLILLDFITRTILGDDYKSFSFSSCSLLHSPVTSSLLGHSYTIFITYFISDRKRR